MRSTPSDDLNPLPTPPDRPEPARNSAPPILVIDGAVLLPELPRFQRPVPVFAVSMATTLSRGFSDLLTTG